MNYLKWTQQGYARELNERFGVDFPPRKVEDFARAVSWHPEIAGLIIPADTPYTDDGSDRHWQEPSSLFVCRGAGSYRRSARGKRTYGPRVPLPHGSTYRIHS